MTTCRACLVLLGACALAFAGCGGGGAGAQAGSSTYPVSAYVLEWDPPTTFSDHKPLDPARDLGCYEVYLRQDGNFTDRDLPVAKVPALTPVDGPGPSAPGGHYRPPRSTVVFSLDALLPLAARGRPNYISMRAVGVDGMKSEFMPAVPWDLG